MAGYGCEMTIAGRVWVGSGEFWVGNPLSYNMTISQWHSTYGIYLPYQRNLMKKIDEESNI